MTIENRIRRWRNEEQGDETDDVIDLLCTAETKIRELRAALKARTKRKK